MALDIIAENFSKGISSVSDVADQPDHPQHVHQQKPKMAPKIMAARPKLPARFNDISWKPFFKYCSCSFCDLGSIC